MKNFNIELIYPVVDDISHNCVGQERGFLQRKLAPRYGQKTSLSTAPLGLLRVAGSTPTSVNGYQSSVTIHDEAVRGADMSRWDGEQRPDLVGISSSTAILGRARYLALEAIRRNIPTVIGGPHPSIFPEDLLDTGAAIVKGRGEAIWPEIVQQAAEGTLNNRVYNGQATAGFDGLTSPPTDYFDPKDYFSVNVLEAGEGCPYECPFCSTRLVKGNYRARNLEDVLAEIDQFNPDDGTVIITDDNFFLHPNIGAIIERFGERGLTWYASVSSRLAVKNDDILKLAGENGCLLLFLGIDRLEGLDKNKGVDLDKAVAKIRSHKIVPGVGFVLGCGHPTVGEFKAEAHGVRRFLMKNRVPLIHVSNSVPYPGTPEYDLKADRTFDGVVLDTQGPLTYEPQNMTADEANEVYYQLSQDLYGIPSILQRVSSAPSLRRGTELFFYNVNRWRHIQQSFAGV